MLRHFHFGTYNRTGINLKSYTPAIVVLLSFLVPYPAFDDVLHWLSHVAYQRRDVSQDAQQGAAELVFGWEEGQLTWRWREGKGRVSIVVIN